jgi:hypothetical protein
MLSCNRNIHIIVAVALVGALMMWPIEPVKAAILHQCVDQAIAGAVAGVHSESLSAYRGLQFHRQKRRMLVEVPKSVAVRESVVR